VNKQSTSHQSTGLNTKNVRLQKCGKHVLSNTITRKDIGVGCRHDMRPSIQLSNVSDGKLGLTMVRPSLQSTPEPPVLDPQPVVNMCARYAATS